MNIMDRQSDEEIIRTARLLAGHDRPEPEEPDDHDPQIEQWHAEISARLEGEAGLVRSLDEDLRKAEVAEKMAPFEPDGPWAHAPKSAREQSLKRVVDAQNERSGRALFELESLLAQIDGPVSTAIARMKAAPDPAEIGVDDGRDPMLRRIFIELRRGRREPWLRALGHSARLRAYIDEPVSVEDAVDVEILEQLVAAGIGPSTTDPKELHAADELRKRIDQARERRVSERAKLLLERIATARKACSRARRLHKIRAVPPARVW